MPDVVQADRCRAPSVGSGRGRVIPDRQTVAKPLALPPLRPTPPELPVSLPVSRRSFLSLATSGLAVSALGLTPAAEAARKRAAAPAAPSVALAAGTVYLNFNEHPTGLSPAALDAASRSLARSGRYLFEMEQDLRNLMAGELQLPHDHLAFFPGSSDPLNRAGTLFTSPRAGLVMADPTFEALADLAAAQGVPVRKVPLRADGAHDVKAMAKADPSAGLIYLCNPNNPTGSITPRAEIEWLLANKPASAVLVVDEAYIHYSTEPSVADLVRQRQDLIVLRTFSKLYGMAGMRLGAALAPGSADQAGQPGWQPAARPGDGRGHCQPARSDAGAQPPRRQRPCPRRHHRLAEIQGLHLPAIAGQLLHGRRQARRQGVRRLDAEAGRHRRPQLADLAQAGACHRGQRGRNAALPRGVC